jgi:hypothetical protein
MLVGYFGLTLLHTQKEASDAWVKLGDGSLLSFLDGEVRPSSWAYYPRSEQVDRIAPMPPHGGTWGRKKEREGWGFSRFWNSGPPTGGPHDGLLAQR